jgi:RimJ/RimL family protein N-acetyltransferase
MKIAKTELTNAEISLIPPKIDDVIPCYEAVQETINDLSQWMWWYHSDYSIDDTRKWIASRPEAWEKGTEYGYAIKDSKNDSFIGVCGVNNINWIDKYGNLGYWIKTSCSGKGIATAATLLLAQFAFNELALNRVEIVVATNNVASTRVAEKAGASREGTLRNRITVRENTYDAFMFSLIPDDIRSEVENK